MHDEAYIFDVDGTLTESRKPIDPAFAAEFLEFQKNHFVYLVTGSDYPKTLEQVGEEIIMNCVKTFHCGGNEGRIHGKVFYANEWMPSNKLLAELAEHLDWSNFPRDKRATKHIEYRQGSINFSVVGRDATWEQREAYRDYDWENSERLWLCVALMERFRNIEAQIGGETGIDIMPRGLDKSQILKYIEVKETIFVGDGVGIYGNDASIALECDQGYKVRNVDETRRLIKKWS
jgi:phosphomannomutase